MTPPSVIQGPHCLIDADTKARIDTARALELVSQITRSLAMRPLGEPRVVAPRADELTVYQIISTSHIIMHITGSSVHADIFSCEPFDVDLCVSQLIRGIEADPASVRIQYCQRNLVTAPGDAPSIPMGNLNVLTSNPHTFTHAMINWYSGDRALLADAARAEAILSRALEHLTPRGSATGELRILGVDPVESSWDQGGVSGGFVDIQRQLTIHTFAGLNGAYTDIMAHTFDLESIIRIIRDDFGFAFYEVDGVFQRQVRAQQQAQG